jgi:hemerythrin
VGAGLRGSAGRQYSTPPACRQEAPRDRVGAIRRRVDPSDQPGLRLRLAHEARRIASQHDYLDALVSTTRSTLEHGERDEVRRALHGFRGAVEAHFDLEEQVHFPALHGADPGRDAQLAELERDHAALRLELADLEAQARADRERAALVGGFDALVDRLASHEAREERLLAEASRR